MSNKLNKGFHNHTGSFPMQTVIFTSYVTMEKLLNIYKPQFALLEKRGDSINFTR